MSDPGYQVADWSAPSMGGMLAVAVAADPHLVLPAERAAERVGRRVTAWANRLTHHQQDSDLSRLNSDESAAARVRPTLGSALAWARTAGQASAGVVDVTLLDARLAAESGAQPRQAPAGGADWSIECGGRHAQVTRSPGVHFDLDGVAKGWLADRASWLLMTGPAASSTPTVTSPWPRRVVSNGSSMSWIRARTRRRRWPRSVSLAPGAGAERPASPPPAPVSTAGLVAAAGRATT